MNRRKTDLKEKVGDTRRKAERIGAVVLSYESTMKGYVRLYKGFYFKRDGSKESVPRSVKGGIRDMTSGPKARKRIDRKVALGEYAPELSLGSSGVSTATVFGSLFPVVEIAPLRLRKPNLPHEPRAAIGGSYFKQR